MADAKVSALTAHTAVAEEDYLYIVDDPGGTPTSKKATVQELRKGLDSTIGIYNVVDYGAVADGSTDDASAIQSAIDAAIAANGGMVVLPPGTYSVQSTLEVYDCYSVSLVGTSRGGKATYGSTILEWDGASGGTVLHLDRARACRVENLLIRPGANDITVGIDIDLSVAGTITTTDNVFDSVSVLNAQYGYRISNSSSVNVEFMTFYNCIAYHDASATAAVGTTYGVHISSANAKDMRFFGGGFTECDYAVYLDNGTVSMYSVDLGQNTTAIYINTANDKCLFSGCSCEGVEQFLVSPFGSTPEPVTIIGCRINTAGVETSTYRIIEYEKYGALNLIGNFFAGEANAVIRANSGRVNSIGNYYPQSTPFSGNGRVMSIGDVYRTSGTSGEIDTQLGGAVEITGTLAYEGVQAFGANDATPSVSGGNFFKTANTGATTITDFDDGTDGQVIRVIINDTNTTIDFTSSGLKGNGGADWSPTTGDWMECVYDGTDWYCSVHDCTA